MLLTFYITYKETCLSRVKEAEQTFSFIGSILFMAYNVWI